MENSLGHTCFIARDKVISLSELVLNNCVFSFHGKLYQNLQGAAMAYPVSPVIANIYMEYFEEIAIDPQFPIPTPWWKRYLADVTSIVKYEQVDTLQPFKSSCIIHSGSSWQYGSISFLDTKCTPNSDHTIHTSLYRRPAYTDQYLDWNFNHPNSAKKEVIHALIYRA